MTARATARRRPWPSIYTYYNIYSCVNGPPAVVLLVIWVVRTRFRRPQHSLRLLRISPPPHRFGFIIMTKKYKHVCTKTSEPGFPRRGPWNCMQVSVIAEWLSSGSMIWYSYTYIVVLLLPLKWCEWVVADGQNGKGIFWVNARGHASKFTIP